MFPPVCRSSYNHYCMTSVEAKDDIIKASKSNNKSRFSLVMITYLVENAYNFTVDQRLFFKFVSSR